MKLHWDFFCTVIDNFGDIGIVWRISRQLADEYGQAVRIWIDDLDSFQRICPRIEPGMACQQLDGIEIRRWDDDMADVAPAEVVVEAFACHVPAHFLEAMANRQTRLVWVNLEYFSAEVWVKECHGLPSPHPRYPLTQYFFVPGLGHGTGGVPGSERERARLAAFRGDTRQRNRFWASLGVDPDSRLNISLFAYDNPAIEGLIKALEQGPDLTRLLVPEGKAVARVAPALGMKKMRVGNRIESGNLVVQVLPFMEQGDYDRLIWACDLNFVRGEDSFIQALWAGSPLVWQAYVQEDGAHWQKIDAFLEHYTKDMPLTLETLFRETWRVWNAGEKQTDIWLEWLRKREACRAHAVSWVKKMQAWPNLVDELMKFVVNKL